jgi:cation:H+ antiporter
VIGGNACEVLFLGAADVAYRPCSIYQQFSAENRFSALLAILMTGVLLLGMLRRECHEIAGIGFESALVLALYVGGVGLPFI